MPHDHWRERAALKDATRERVRALSGIPFEEYAAVAESAAAAARVFLASNADILRGGRVPGTRTGFAKVYREAHDHLESLAAASFVLDEEDPFHLFGATTDRVRRAFPFVAEVDVRRYVIRKLHDFTAPADPELPLRGTLAESLYRASESYRRLVALKLHVLNDPMRELSGLLDVLARYAPVVAGVPESEAATFQAMPFDRKLRVLEGTSALGRRS